MTSGNHPPSGTRTNGQSLVGKRFESTSRAPGYQPDRFTVVGVLDARWVQIRRRPGGSPEPCRVETLLNPKLYREVIVDPHELPWASWPWQRCGARREKVGGHPYGRCELRRGHAGDHALERGFDTPRWSTRWTQ